MNALGYALLSMLVRKPRSGYELKQLLEVFWQAKHSQIYPLLTKLQQEELVTSELVGQCGKPDKKNYAITEKGLSVLKEWIPHPPAIPVSRDEFLIKVNAIGLTDIPTAKALFEERIAFVNKKVAYREQEIKSMEQTLGEDVKDISSKSFGRYLLFHRKLRENREEIEWCRWALSLLDRSR